MAESIGILYSTEIPSLSETADIQEALRLYHYGAPSGTGVGEYDPTNSNSALLVNPSIAYYLNNLQSQITTVSGSLGVQASVWTTKGDLVTRTSSPGVVRIGVGLDGTVLTANSTEATGLEWAALPVTLTNSVTLTNKTLTAPKISSASNISDANGNELIVFPTAIASAVNEITISNAIATATPSITASGNDTNISLNLISKGTGTIQVNGVTALSQTNTVTAITNKTFTAPRITSGSNIADSNGNELIVFPSAVASAVNEITVTNAIATASPSISASGGDTNISLNLISKGTGTIQANGVDIVTTTGTQTLTNKTIDTIAVSGSSVAAALWNTTLTTGSISAGGALTSGGITLAGGTTFAGTIAIANASTSAHNISISNGAGTTNKTINIGTGSTGGTTAINLGSSSGATSTITANGIFIERKVTNAQSGTNYNIQASDESKIIEMSNSLANTVTVPNLSAVPVGAQINILQTGTGQTTVVAGTNVTINGTPGLKLRSQWGMATLIKRTTAATDVWVLVGDIVA